MPSEPDATNLAGTVDVLSFSVVDEKDHSFTILMTRSQGKIALTTECGWKVLAAGADQFLIITDEQELISAFFLSYS